jgi:hypothetical protein
MSKEQIRQEATRLMKELGRGAFSAKFPNDFEYYLLSFDLKNDNKTVASLVFPVNPDQIRYNKQYNTTIRKTLSGVSVVINPTFNPFPITLSGTFGRSMKTLFSPDSGKILNLQGALLTTNLIPTFNFSVKTGYGCFKLLEKMISMCNQIDEKTKKPYVLQFTDLSINESYYVEIKSFTPEMSVGRNMLWYYSINMMAVAESKLTFIKRAKLIGRKVANEGITKLTKKISEEIKNVDLNDNIPNLNLNNFSRNLTKTIKLK